MRWRRRWAMRSRSLCGAVARRLERLVAGDGRASERALGALLEDRAQPLERDAHLAPDPRAPAGQRLLEAVPPDAGLGPDGAGDLRRAIEVAQLPLHPAGRTSPAPDAAAFDDQARLLRLNDLELGARGEQRRVDQEGGAGSHAHRVDARQPVVLQEVVHPRDPAGGVEDEREHLLARRGDDYARL